jgi:mannosyl-oligosaccharide alpha-1,2-mannosidase
LRSQKLNSPLYENPFPKVPADPLRQSVIKEAFLHAWSNYDRHCFGHDSYSPLSRECRNSLSGGLTIIDSLSTFLVMNLTAEFEKARRFVLTKFSPRGAWSLFEFIIRYLGGLISAADLTDDPALKETAVALGQAILKAIEPFNGTFASHRFRISTRARNSFKVWVSSGSHCIAEDSSFQLEFLALARLTGDPRFVKVALSAYRHLWSKRQGLIGNHIGACQDSYYEYVLKSYLLTGGRSKEILNNYLLIVRHIRDRLLFKTIHRELHGIGQASPGGIFPMMEHLATFAGGMFAIGSVKDNPNATDDLELAAQLALTYATVYREMKSGVAPEHVMYNTNNKKDTAEFWDAGAPEYRLRPESVESVYIMWKFTGLQKYRDYAWDMFQGINRSCRVEYGFAAITNATVESSKHQNEMASFFLAETLKYLYLIFSDSDILSPVDWVLSTEAHPVRMWDEETIQKFAELLDWKPK